MRTSIIAAALLTGLGTAPLVTPAAAVPAGPASAIAVPTDAIVNVRMKRSRMMRMGGPSTSNGPSTATRGAPAGSTGGNGVTGSGAAPSGK